MKIEIFEKGSTLGLKVIYEITLDEKELKDAVYSFDGYDQLLIKECDKSEKVSDKLLALEMIVRKIETMKNQKINP